jgi:hypothetical protein
MAVPAITSISASGGPAGGGTSIVITGTNLGTPTGVSFGAVAAASFAGVSATQAFAVAPAGTGTVHVTLTTTGGTSATGAADQFTYGAALFTVAEARAFNNAALASATDYSDAAVIAKEAEIREWLTRVCGVDFVPTVHTDEYHSGDGSRTLLLDWPLVTTLTAVSLRSDDTWTAFSADELDDVRVAPGGSGLLYREGSWWPYGWDNVKATYTAGHVSVPALIKRAALRVCAQEMPTSNVPFSAESYDAGGMNVSFAQGDGYQGHWHRDAEVMKAIRMYDRSLPGVS